jgi:hypothetical protein
MAREPIPEDLRRFILTSIPSVPFVEAMLIYREARGAAVSNELIARRLYMAEKAAAGVIEQLYQAGIVAAAGADPVSYRFNPASPELAAMLETLAAYYRSHLVEVTDLIHSRTARRAQQFADAFKLRKDS